LTMIEWFRMKRRKRLRKLKEMSIIPAGKLRDIKINTKAGLKTLRDAQDKLREQFPGSVDKDWWKKL
jgi:hypothetical protein